MKYKKYLIHYKKLFYGLGLVLIVIIGVMISFMFTKHNFIKKDQIIGIISPDTLKIKYAGKELVITSDTVKAARGNEGCRRAKEMANKGYKILDDLLKDAKVIRFVFSGGKEDGKYINANIFIDEVQLGKILYQNKAAIKYTDNQQICEK